MLSSAGEVKEDAFAAVATIKTAADTLPTNSPARKIILDLCARSNGDLERFRSLLESWFNTFEDQVTAWYKQKTHLVVGAMSLVLVCTMNIDTVALVRQLATDTKVRTAMVAVALEISNAPDLGKVFDTTARDKATAELTAKLGSEKTAAEALAKDRNNATLKVEAQDAASAAATAQQTADTEQAAVMKRVADLAQGLTAAGVRVGWTAGDWAALWRADGVAPDWLALLVKLVGFLVSTAAISLGAPFWFNTLKTLASIRSVGPSTDESKAKRIKDKAAP